MDHETAYSIGQKWLLGIVYCNAGSCSSEQARSMPYWAETQVARFGKYKPELVVVVGIGDSCQPSVHKAFQGFAPVLWVDLVSTDEKDGEAVVKAIASAMELAPIIVSCKLEID